MGRVSVLVGALLVAAMTALAPALAEAARAGGGASLGSRGARTYQAVPSTPTAQQARPIERSATPQSAPTTVAQAPRPASAAAVPQAAATQGGFFQRNPFLGAVMGGLLGAGIGGLLFGGGFFGDGLGLGGVLGLALQLGLIFLVVRLVMAYVTRSRAAGAVAASGRYAYATDRNARYAAPATRAAGAVPPVDLGSARAGVTPQASLALRDEVGIKATDYAEFEKLLVVVQKAWSSADVATLAHHLTPELLSYFSERLAAINSAGLVNHVDDVRFEDGDLAEAWTEDDLQFATVAMKWRARDYTTRVAGGEVVEGKPDEVVTATEVWTFVRAPGGRWLLSAIQQI